MTLAEPQVYEQDGPLPGPGILVFEASAGTGKTHAIKDLVRRFIVEGVAGLDEMLIMTFSRSATQELRDRIRKELHAVAGDDNQPLHARHAIQAALSNFDAANIATIHQSCIDAFARLGIAADAESGEVIAEQVRDLVHQVVTEVYLGRYAEIDPDTKFPNPKDARAIAKAVLANGDAALVPLVETTGADSIARQRLWLAETIRATFPERQRELRQITFDDIVARLAETIALSAPARSNLGNRFKVVLVDEFQDTDPSQWAIIANTFANRPDRRVILIGDPKQGIYSFRGADIHSYSAARSHSGAVVRTMGVNYRSDAAVVDGLAEMLLGLNFGGKELGQEIVVGGIQAHHLGTRLADAHPGDNRRVRIRCLRTPPGDRLAAEERIAEDVADELVAGLAAGRQFIDAHGVRRPVIPSDFAVIVRENRQAEMIRKSLVRRGVPAVVNARTTVFVSRAANDWLVLLSALEQPRPGNVRAAALTPFFGVTAPDLVADRESVTSHCAEELRVAAAEFGQAGIPAIAARFTTGTGARAGMAERLLRTSDGERYLTDLRHVASLLHRQQREQQLGLSGLRAWLAEQLVTATSADSDEQAESLVRRIDTDAEAVQVVTIHSAKGLQFPITYVPFGWGPAPRADSIPVATQGGRRLIDVRGISDATKTELAASAKADQRAESLRMFYVALTRGISEVVVWWTQLKGSSVSSPIQRIISAKAHGHTLPKDTYPKMEDPASVFMASRLIGVEDIGDQRDLVWSGPASDHEPMLRAADYTRSDDDAEHPIDAAWSRPSFTGLTRGIRHRPTDVEIDPSEAGVKDDEVDVHGPPALEAAIVPSPLAGVPGGMAFGDLAHRVLEHLDLDAEDLDADLLRSCTDQLRRRPLSKLEPTGLAAGLSPALRTPLAGKFGSTSLAELSNADRLAELEFELALGNNSVAGLGGVIAEHAADPWLRDYGTSLGKADFSWRSLRGFLTGSIDALLRIDGRYIVVDYKTNLVGPRDGDVGHYAREPLKAAMTQAHYPLQALLYTVAVHRFLHWRLRTTYSPEEHLGGVRYLFLRGMAGPRSPVLDGWPTGVFGFDPGADLVLALDDALGGAR